MLSPPFIHLTHSLFSPLTLTFFPPILRFMYREEMGENAQRFGVQAIGALVAREFGDGKIYVGTIKKYLKASGDDPELYHVSYEDGDCEDWDREEYNYGYSLHLSNEGWNVEEGSEGDSDGGEQMDDWHPSKDDNLQKDDVREQRKRLKLLPHFEKSRATKVCPPFITYLQPN